MNPTNHWKLGMFVVLGNAVAFFALVALGAAKFDKPHIQFVTYFDESVQGLELGSPVKFRGVRVGKVAAIRVAENRRHVEVTCDVDIQSLERLGLRDPTQPQEDRGFVPPELRVQLAQPGIAGGKFLLIDFFDLKDHPPPGLPFPTPKNYIPATASTLKNLEQSLVHTLNKFPRLVDQASDLLAKSDRFLAKIDAQGISEKTTGALDEWTALIKDIRADLKKLDVAKLSQEGHATLKRADGLLVRLEKKGGLVENMEVSSKKLRTELDQIELAKRVDKTFKKVDGTLDSVRRVARDNSGLGEDLEATLKAIRLASDAVRRLADTLERDSDMLLKGRAKGKRK